MGGVRLSVCPSVACLNLTRERKGLGSPKLAEWKHITRVTRFRGQKVNDQSHQGINAVTDIALHISAGIPAMQM